MRNTILADALYNLAHDSGASDDYCRGLVVGIVSGLMGAGHSYNGAISAVCEALPQYAIKERFPNAFMDDILAELERTRTTTI